MDCHLITSNFAESYKIQAKKKWGQLILLPNQFIKKNPQKQKVQAHMNSCKLRYMYPISKYNSDYGLKKKYLIIICVRNLVMSVSTNFNKLI